MKNPDDRAFIYDIGQAIDQVWQYTNKITKDEFFASQLLQDTVVRQLEVGHLNSFKLSRSAVI
ncbi:MAG: hypothetical protein AAB613_00170 [Patescibacteria group bacterium]